MRVTLVILDFFRQQNQVDKCGDEERTVEGHSRPGKLNPPFGAFESAFELTELVLHPVFVLATCLSKLVE